MPAKVTFDYAEYFRIQKRGNYPEIAKLIRQGDISDLCQDSRNLLANYLERRPGKPKGNDFFLAEHLYGELKCLQKYGRTHDKLLDYYKKNATQENYRTVFEPLKADKMDRESALERLAEKEKMTVKTVREKVEAYGSYLRKNEDMR